MDWLLISGIIVFGLLLVMLELFLLPGTTVVGIIGALCIMAGVVLAYVEYGFVTGSLFLAGAAGLSIIMLIAGVDRIRKGRLSLKGHVEGRVNVLEKGLVNVGDEGVTFNYLRPNGKATINGRRVEVYSMGEYVESKTPVRVVKIDGSKIYIKKITDN